MDPVCLKIYNSFIDTEPSSATTLNEIHDVNAQSEYVFPRIPVSNNEEMPEDMHHNLPPQDTQAPQNGNKSYNPSAITYKILPTMS